jgi:hypothetical protein
MNHWLTYLVAIANVPDYSLWSLTLNILDTFLRHLDGRPAGEAGDHSYR